MQEFSIPEPVTGGCCFRCCGSTPTAIANMTAVTKRYVACHVAFIAVPLVGAFLIDLTNALIIQLLLD